jgi:hypothetical protein
LLSAAHRASTGFFEPTACNHAWAVWRTSMTELEFTSLANEGYNRIPLISEAFADLETPLTLYLKLAQTQNAGKNTFLLESVVGGERFGRYSSSACPPRRCCAPSASAPRSSRTAP